MQDGRARAWAWSLLAVFCLPALTSLTARAAYAGEGSSDHLSTAIAAYDATAANCAYEPIVGEVLGELDTFAAERNPSWAEMKREGRDAISVIRNMGQIVGARSDCVVLGRAVGLGLYSALAIGKLVPPLLQEIDRLTNGGGHALVAAHEPSSVIDQSCDPSSAPGMMHAYNRQHGIPDGRPSCPGDGAFTASRAPNPGAIANPRLADVLSAVTLSFAHDDGLDRALLVQGDNFAADLYIVKATARSELGEAAPKPIFVKQGIAFAEGLELPSLRINERGSLVIASSHEGYGRMKSEQQLVIAYRGGEFIVAGLSYSVHDSLDPNAGGSCELNLLLGKAQRNGKQVTDRVGPVRLEDWSNDDLPKPCLF